MTVSEQRSDDRVRTQYNGETKFLSADSGEVHISEIQPNLNFVTGHHVNALLRGHLAFRVDNIEELKENLEINNIPYVDGGQWAMKGWHQVFFHDPDGNVIEVHQVME
jgi:glyoxylase I family protein